MRTFTPTDLAHMVHIRVTRNLLDDWFNQLNVDASALDDDFACRLLLMNDKFKKLFPILQTITIHESDDDYDMSAQFEDDYSVN